MKKTDTANPTSAPKPRGKHVTTPEARKRARFLAKFGIKPYVRPVGWTTGKPVLSAEVPSQGENV